MKFLSEDFLLNNENAKLLFHKHAEKMPIIDYHCHLEQEEIYENKKDSSRSFNIDNSIYCW